MVQMPRHGKQCADRLIQHSIAAHYFIGAPLKVDAVLAAKNDSEGFQDAASATSEIRATKTMTSFILPDLAN